MHIRVLVAALAVVFAASLFARPDGASARSHWSASVHDRPVPAERPAKHTPEAAKPERRHAPKAKRAAKPKKARKSRPRRPRPHRATPSFYVDSLSGGKMARRGCLTGRSQTSGIVVLAFGRQYARGRVYGTQTFAGGFASNRSITKLMKTFARAYARCVPRRSRARIVLARGTSNYRPAVASTFRSGRRWARETVAFARFLKRSGLSRRIQSAAAIDAEPAWNPGFRRTRDFFRGYRAARPGIALYNFGSLDGGVGVIWSARQVWYVSSGMRYARMIPEVYYPGMAQQWAEMSRIALRRYGRPVRFAGVMTQHRAAPGCRCGYKPKQAHRLLVRELNTHEGTRVGRLPMTNIRWR